MLSELAEQHLVEAVSPHWRRTFPQEMNGGEFPLFSMNGDLITTLDLYDFLEGDCFQEIRVFELVERMELGAIGGGLALPGAGASVSMRWFSLSWVA